MASIIKVPVSAYMLDVFPYSFKSNKLATPSFWTKSLINAAFAEANRIWTQAQIQFDPIQITERDIFLHDKENDMWADFVNELTPKKGIGAGFLYDFPGPEGGIGGGRIAVVGKKKGAGARDGFLGGILAHELGHVLLDHTHKADRHNLMYESRSPQSVTKDTLDGQQKQKAREMAALYAG